MLSFKLICIRSPIMMINTRIPWERIIIRYIRKQSLTKLSRKYAQKYGGIVTAFYCRCVWVYWTHGTASRRKDGALRPAAYYRYGHRWYCRGPGKSELSADRLLASPNFSRPKCLFRDLIYNNYIAWLRAHPIICGYSRPPLDRRY